MTLSAVRGPQHVVGIGASAGGVEAFKLLVQTFRMDSTAFVFLLHFPPDATSNLTTILQTRTDLPVERIDDGVRMKPNVIYVMAPGHDILVRAGALHLRAFEGRPRASTIDRFFFSLAEERGEQSVGVVLSGVGKDGAAGLRSIRDAGGLACVQTPASALHPEMPTAALPSASVCLPPLELGQEMMKRLGIQPMPKRSQA
jgi:chemotaxis response regulator CheB